MIYLNQEQQDREEDMNAENELVPAATTADLAPADTVEEPEEEAEKFPIPQFIDVIHDDDNTNDDDDDEWEGHELELEHPWFYDQHPQAGFDEQHSHSHPHPHPHPHQHRPHHHHVPFIPFWDQHQHQHQHQTAEGAGNNNINNNNANNTNNVNDYYNHSHYNYTHAYYNHNNGYNHYHYYNYQYADDEEEENDFYDNPDEDSFQENYPYPDRNNDTEKILGFHLPSYRAIKMFVLVMVVAIVMGKKIDTLHNYFSCLIYYVIPTY